MIKIKCSLYLLSLLFMAILVAISLILWMVLNGGYHAFK